MIPVSGVYAVKHTQTGACYVGSSRDIATRWDGHRNALIRGQHGNKNLQRAWLNAPQQFVCILLEPVAPDGARLVAAERRWLEWLRNAGVPLYSEMDATRNDQKQPSAAPLPGLRDRRILAALTQTQLAEIARVSRLSVVRLEGGGQANPSMVRRLADALKCEPRDLILPK